jgi:acetolactate synthase-1/2/3 large subunit
VTDMGTALLSGHQVIRLKKNQRMMTSTGLGEMGFGLPAAIGASFARNRGEVICLNCDGGMMMNLQELQTIAHHHLPIKTFIFNNDGYLMIKHTQKALFEGRYSGTNVKSGVSCPDFDMVMPKVLEASGPVFCEVFMHPEQLLVPKLGLSLQKDGSIISPPLEDLSPFLPREQVREAMIIGMHPKSEKINS